MREPAKSVDAYIAAAPEEYRAALERLRSLIKRAAPEAEEGIAYGMPSLKYRGRVLVYFAAFKNHLSFFPASSSLLEAFGSELKQFKTSKGTIQFTPGKPLPEALVRKIVKARIAETLAGNKKREARKRGG